MPLRLGLAVLVVVLVVAFRVVAVIVFVVISLCTQRVEVDFVDDAAQHRRTGFFHLPFAFRHFAQAGEAGSPPVAGKILSAG